MMKQSVISLSILSLPNSVIIKKEKTKSLLRIIEKKKKNTYKKNIKKTLSPHLPLQYA